MPADLIELAERKLEKMAPGQLAPELMRLPARRRMEVIVARPDAQSVVAAMDANDFFHTVKEIGADDSLPILALASQEQLNHLFDIEWWRKDALEPAKALTWIERLRQAGGSRLQEWLAQADFELLVSLFKRWITVDIAPEDIDMVEAAEQLPPKTLDDFYFWESMYPQYDDLITSLLTVIFETNYGFFKELMNSVINASTVEIEETEYHFHQARLSDRAIPDFYDALEIYRAIKPEEFSQKEIRGRAQEDETGPSFALALLPEEDLFSRAVRRANDPDLAWTLQVEAAALANKVIVADQVSLDNAESLRGAVEKTLAYVNLGLEMLADADVEKASGIIRNVFLEHLFRLAQAEVAGIRGRLQAAVRSGWLSRCPTGLKIFDREWFDTVEELLANTPRILKNRSNEGPSVVLPDYDFFRTPRDIERGNRIVDVIVAGAGALYDLLGTDPVSAGWDLWTEGQVSEPEDVTLGIMILTGAANFLISGKWGVEPLSGVSWPDAFPSLQPPDIDQAVMDRVHGAVSDPEKRFLAQDYLVPILRDYDFEMRPFSERNPPEPHLVKFFMFRE